MAIKISGNTVIDDSRNFCNLNTVTATCYVGDASGMTGVQAVEVLQPTNTNPADGATGVTTTPTLCGSGFFSLYGKSHANSQFQVSIDSGFSNTEVDVFTGANTHLVIPSLSLFETQHFFRVRYFDADGCCSEFSDPTCFTTGAAFDILGSSTCGGFYMGTICADGSCYYLIMAPNATGCASCFWKTTRTASGVGVEVCDGYGNTYDHLCDFTHPAGNWTRTRTINGFSDWYLPAQDELLQLYANAPSAPAGEGFFDTEYWSSTENDFARPRAVSFNDGDIQSFNRFKNSFKAIRAIRRVPF